MAEPRFLTSQKIDFFGVRQKKTRPDGRCFAAKAPEHFVQNSFRAFTFDEKRPQWKVKINPIFSNFTSGKLQRPATGSFGWGRGPSALWIKLFEIERGTIVKLKYGTAYFVSWGHFLKFWKIFDFWSNMAGACEGVRSGQNFFLIFLIERYSKISGGPSQN